MRLLVSASLIIAWAMPALTATVVWQWIFDTEYGLANWAFDRQGESWLADPMTLLQGGDDHRRLDGHPVRGLHRVRRAHADPRRPLEAAKLDGAGSGRGSATSSFPALKPILMILTSLSVMWDFRVFTQIYVLQQAGGITRDTNLLGVYAYQHLDRREPLRRRRRGRHRDGAITIILTLVYLRSMFRTRRTCECRCSTRRGSAPASTPPGCSSPSIALFPVYWMVLTSLRRSVDIQTLTPSFLPTNADARQLPQGVRARLLLDGDAQQRDGHA